MKSKGENQNAELAIKEATPANFESSKSFDLMQRQAKALASSDLIPKAYQNNVGNCMIALDMANRTKISAIMVMQNLDIIHGKPSWSSKFIIAAINMCGKFSPLRFRMAGEGEERSCTAYATDMETGEKVEGVTVSIAMAKSEGWHGKPGSKWKTMPELMLRYRAAAFFGRLYVPEITMGMLSADEVEDIQQPTQQEKEKNRVRQLIEEETDPDNLSTYAAVAAEHDLIDLLEQKEKELKS